MHQTHDQQRHRAADEESPSPFVRHVILVVSIYNRSSWEPSFFSVLWRNRAGILILTARTRPSPACPRLPVSSQDAAAESGSEISAGRHPGTSATDSPQNSPRERETYARPASAIRWKFLTTPGACRQDTSGHPPAHENRRGCRSGC